MRLSYFLSSVFLFLSMCLAESSLQELELLHTLHVPEGNQIRQIVRLLRLHVETSLRRL